MGALIQLTYNFFQQTPALGFDQAPVPANREAQLPPCYDDIFEASPLASTSAEKLDDMSIDPQPASQNGGLKQWYHCDVSIATLRRWKENAHAERPQRAMMPDGE